MIKLICFALAKRRNTARAAANTSAALSAVWVDHPNVVLSPRLVGYAPGDICSHAAKRKNYGLVAAFAIDASIALPQSLLN